MDRVLVIVRTQAEADAHNALLGGGSHAVPLHAQVGGRRFDRISLQAWLTPEEMDSPAAREAIRAQIGHWLCYLDVGADHAGTQRMLEEGLLPVAVPAC